MSSRVTEYVGASGVQSSDLQWRIRSPHAGDPVLWPNEKIGRIDHLGHPNTGLVEPGQALVCCEEGSVFLGWNSPRRQPTADISGGPFLTVKLAELEWAVAIKVVRFWNWGDNLPGADMGVEYWLPRPLWRYTGDSDHYAITKASEQ